MSYLKERLQFESPKEADDGQGGKQDGWQTVFCCRGAYKRLRGTERVLAGRLEGVQPTEIRVRYSAETTAVGTDHRIVDRKTGEIFNIRSRIETNDRRWIDFTCESGVGQ